MPSTNLTALVAKPAGWLNTVHALTVKLTHLNTKRRGEAFMPFILLHF